MRKVNRIKLYLGVSNMLMISGIVAKTMSLFWLIILIVSVLFIVAVVPWCRQHENMWLFVLTAIGSVPINITLTHYILDIGIFETDFPVVGVLITSLEIYLLLLGIEEIIIGVLGRMIWKRQKTMDEVV
ncbi:MAG: hypothetical protein ACI4EW_06115 [Butyrivibrio sp.]